MKPQELDVDFVGGQEPLTKEEEKAISEFLLLRKSKKQLRSTKPKTFLKKSNKIEI
ncbi:MAG: hypothetical protein JEY97_05315 [Bacteroidales bacterium]|nr:hypothetical protein [Bacteroidales bacterium]